MLTKVLSRLVSGTLLVLAVVTFTFLLINMAPGDPARLWVGPGAGAAELAAAREALGLDQPLPVRYLTWLGQFATGNWGTSLIQQRPVVSIVAAALPHTLLLSAASLLVTYVGSLLLGIFQAERANSGWDRTLSVASLTVYGVPAYWLAAMLVMVFSYASARYGWPPFLRLPAMGVAALDAEYLSTWGQLVDRARHLILPLTTLGLIGLAGTSRFVRGSVLDVMHQPHVTAAHARGIDPTRVRFLYIARNAIVPIVTLAGLSLPALFSGTVFVEVVFAWPGMGREIVGAVASRDYPVVMATTTIFATLVVLGNLLADMTQHALDPRART